MMTIRMNHFRGILCLLFMTVFVLNVSAQKKVKGPKVYTVIISKMKFTPSELVVEKGSKVVWINKEFYPHDVTDELKKTWSSKPLNQDQSWSKIITKNESYFCNLHKTMKGKIIVK
ncbi:MULTISPECIES: plastocyanin/azurin family copper-binding protein [unclassified Flavobacterium]|uniref:plastocyanin/azurin family copper-binding protein n=1 Tax=unclassified Flavobacterium TaxID=196869 RepID=UPI001F32DBED|nr:MULTISPECIES: plastocyanin/azurin family copper-binding protein [unclassified Flavobacterium]